MNNWKWVRSVSFAFVLAAAVGTFGFATEGAASAQSPKSNKSRSLEPRADFTAEPRTSRCGVNDPTAEQQLMIDQAAQHAPEDGPLVTVPVYWHVITTSTGGGNISSLIPAQMQVLNNAFATSGFAFTLAGQQVIANNSWFFAEAGSAEEVAMKTALRRGGPDALNIYTTNGDVYLGWATLPFYYKFSPGYDGVVLWWAALPGTGLAGPADGEPDGILTYDQGDTGTHEVGHWLGLNHTFAGGCSYPNDSVRDTAAEAAPQFYCVPRDSCTGPAFRGEDAITNFMNYVDDVCMDNFTSEQTKRMRKQWHAFRDKKAR